MNAPLDSCETRSHMTLMYPCLESVLKVYHGLSQPVRSITQRLLISLPWLFSPLFVSSLKAGASSKGCVVKHVGTHPFFIL